jgi:hypothetical protein
MGGGRRDLERARVIERVCVMCDRLESQGHRARGRGGYGSPPTDRAAKAGPCPLEQARGPLEQANAPLEQARAPLEQARAPLEQADSDPWHTPRMAHSPRRMALRALWRKGGERCPEHGRPPRGAGDAH